MKPKPNKLGAALWLVLASAACVPKTAPPPVQTRPAPTPSPSPAPAPAPVYDSWVDAPQTPGDWTYTGAFAGGVAQFGGTPDDPAFTLRCDAASRTIVLTRASQSREARSMTIRTESQTRTLSAAAAQAGVESRLSASDRLLDAMALSKGRFAVEAPGAPTLYLPSWAEVTRVIEDCR